MRIYYKILLPIILTAMVVVAAILLTSDSSGKIRIKSIETPESWERLFPYSEKLAQLARDNPDDAQILLGVADLANNMNGCHSSPPPHVKVRYLFIPEGGDRIRFEDVIGIDPSNAPAYVQLLKNSVWDYPYVIRYKQKEEVDAILTNIMTRFEEAEKIDPGNAIFNYLRAGMLNYHGKTQEALEEVERGVNKGCYLSYMEDVLKARRRVLEAVEYPWPESGEFQSLRYGMGGVNIIHYLEEILISEGNKIEDSDPDRAEYLYGMMLSVGRQIDRSLFSIDDRTHALWFKIKAYRAMIGLYDKSGMKSKADWCRARKEEAEKEAYAILCYFPPFKDHTGSEYREYVRQVVEDGTWLMFLQNQLNLEFEL